MWFLGFSSLCLCNSPLCQLDCSHHAVLRQGVYVPLSFPSITSKLTWDTGNSGRLTMSPIAAGTRLILTCFVNSSILVDSTRTVTRIPTLYSSAAVNDRAQTEILCIF